MILDYMSHEENAFEDGSCQEEVDKLIAISVFISRLVDKLFFGQLMMTLFGL